MTIARQFGPDVINSVQVLQPQQVMLEVRFIEANRQAGRELGVQWNSFSQSGRFLGNIGNRVEADRLPITPAGDNIVQESGRARPAARTTPTSFARPSPPPAFSPAPRRSASWSAG